ncbi:hypothetical protein YX96_25090, partial [Salmonella enterica subsp. enterica]|nr:hypothetical protein [Salmonella enterica subsp. enterica serovar Paratyphi A]
ALALAEALWLAIADVDADWLALILADTDAEALWLAIADVDADWLADVDLEMLPLPSIVIEKPLIGNLL